MLKDYDYVIKKHPLYNLNFHSEKNMGGFPLKSLNFLFCKKILYTPRKIYISIKLTGWWLFNAQYTQASKLSCLKKVYEIIKMLFQK